MLRVNRNSAQDVIKKLENAGYIQIERGKGSKPSIYRFIDRHWVDPSYNLKNYQDLNCKKS
ncbi:hypothetical protein HWX41_27385 [Bacillus paramycoides]|uniref:helix-turn-helix domain-containing protein n=1 Tax=Bacillus paramycoides TaxID=2026194 RepID=UPI0015B9F602|nr:hypothetical protein [Bacillus paramycoides]